MKSIIVLFMCALGMVLGAADADAVRWPVDNYSVGGYTFWQPVTGWGYHTGLDITAPGNTPVYAPCRMTIKFKGVITNGGGCILAEAFVNGETVVLEFMHVYTDGTCPWKIGNVVPEGDFLSKTAPSKTTYCGPWSAHLHYGVHRGAYANGTACDGTWKYHGYDRNGCDWANWHNPSLFIPFAMNHQRLGGTSTVGYPSPNFFWNGCADMRDYTGGSFGLCTMYMSSNGAWLVRTGFREKYAPMGGPCCWLKRPTGNEYFVRQGAYGPEARQNFEGGYLYWNCSTKPCRAYAYTPSGVCKASADEPIDESIDAPQNLSLSVGPNPARSNAGIAFELPGASYVSLAVYDLGGRVVATLIDGRQEAGEHLVTWDLHGRDGARVAAGAYFIRLFTVNDVRTIKMVVVR